MRPTLRCVLVFAAGLPVSLLAVLVSERLWTLWLAYLGFAVLMTGVDALIVAQGGQVLVAEDGGDMQLVIIDRQGKLTPLLQVVGQGRSEITGPVFSPMGDRLYFSSQRGHTGHKRGIGLTYEVRGPFQRC